MGRPILPAAQKRSVIIAIRVTPSEFKALKHLAIHKKMTIPSLIRQISVDATLKNNSNDDLGLQRSGRKFGRKNMSTTPSKDEDFPKGGDSVT